MKNGWKWILAVAAILLVAAGLFGMGFLFVHRTQMMATIPQSGVPYPQMGHGSMHGGFPGGMVYPRNGSMPMMGGMRGFGRGGGHFSGGMFFGMFGRLIPLALLLLLLYGAYWLGKRHNAPVAVPVTPAVPAAVPTDHPCPSCGNPVQEGWNHCPNCGEKQA